MIYPHVQNWIIIESVKNERPEFRDQIQELVFYAWDFSGKRDKDSITFYSVYCPQIQQMAWENSNHKCVNKH